MRKDIKLACAAVFILVVLGICKVFTVDVDPVDESEVINGQRVMTLPDNVYESITLYLGDTASYTDIMREYERNREMYDTLKPNEVRF